MKKSQDVAIFVDKNFNYDYYLIVFKKQEFIRSYDNICELVIKNYGYN